MYIAKAETQQMEKKPGVDIKEKEIKEEKERRIIERSYIECANPYVSSTLRLKHSEIDRAEKKKLPHRIISFKFQRQPERPNQVVIWVRKCNKMR